MIKAENEDMQNKYRAEKESYDNLLRDKMEIEEKLKRLNVEFADDTKVVEEQDKLLLELRSQIEAELAEVNTLEESCVEERKIQKTE
jgi:chromosome segregation ATPase